MTPLVFVVWALTVHGVTQIVTQSTIFTGVRRFFGRWRFTGGLIVCPLCFGTWVGMLLSLAGFAPVRVLTAGLPFGFSWLPMQPSWPWWAAILLDGGLASGIAWILHLLNGQLARGPVAPSAVAPPPQTVYVQHLGLPSSAPQETDDERADQEEPVAR
jgi:hypothetical protein